MTGGQHVQGIADVWPDKKPLIGMVHLLPLPGSPRWSGPTDAALDREARDAHTLQEAGFDGVLVENFLEVPFFADSVPAETVAAMTAAVLGVMATVSLPIGVNVLRNDAAAAMAIAATSGELGRSRPSRLSTARTPTRLLVMNIGAPAIRPRLVKTSCSGRPRA